jgi:O-methyltransferase
MGPSDIYARLREFTMISEEVFCDNLALAETVRDIPGCVVECGVWRGGMSAGLALTLGPEREYYLFDSFEGLPPAQPIDGPAALRYQEDKLSPSYYDNCAAPPDFARRAMAIAGAKRFQIIEGFFENTVPGFTPGDQIALLRLDVDWYRATALCLRHLFNHVADRGVIIIDDYYTWDGCSRALHDFLSYMNAVERIRSFNGSVCYLSRART